MGFRRGFREVRLDASLRRGGAENVKTRGLSFDKQDT